MSSNEIEELANFRDKGLLISRAIEQTGIACPEGYRLVQCNLNEVSHMEWDPIGKWVPTPNQVLRLDKAPCDLMIAKTDGTQMHFSFKENDYRYIVDKWLVIYCQNKMELTKIKA
jgi:hypothetical protein